MSGLAPLFGFGHCECTKTVMVMVATRESRNFMIIWGEEFRVFVVEDVMALSGNCRLVGKHKTSHLKLLECPLKGFVFHLFDRFSKINISTGWNLVVKVDPKRFSNFKKNWAGSQRNTLKRIQIKDKPCTKWSFKYSKSQMLQCNRCMCQALENPSRNFDKLSPYTENT